MKIIRFKGMKQKGVCGSRASLFRIRRDDPTFPQPVQVGGGVGWIESEIDEWIAARPRIERRAQTSMVADNKLAAAQITPPNAAPPIPVVDAASPIAHVIRGAATAGVQLAAMEGQTN